MMNDEPLHDLIEHVRSHYADSTDPLYLATVGQRLGDTRKALVEAYGSLAAAVRRVGSDSLDLVIPAGRAGSTIVVTPDVREEIEARFGRREPMVGGAVLSFSALPAPVQIAFCVKTDAGEGVAVRTTPPIRYLKYQTDRAPPAGFVAIEPKYRSPGLKLANASPTDLERLWLRFQEWATNHGIDPDRFSRGSPPTNALERFLAAQDPAIASGIVLPADIVSILLRHS